MSTPVEPGALEPGALEPGALDPGAVEPGAVEPPDVSDIESRIARDIARKALVVAPVVVLAVGLALGASAALGAGLALALVVVNFLAAAAILGWTARTMPHALIGVALMSFLGRLVVITIVGVLLKQIPAVDFPAFGITLVVSYLALLFWELRSISLSLASPGLKPRKES